MIAKPDRLVGYWLLVICAMIFGMVAGGGHARTIGAGYSVLVWQPFFGFIPPLTHAAWLRMFALYQQTAQFKILHPTMNLAGFQALFWPMFLDRVWGRLMGLVFLVPLVLFWRRGRVSNRLALWLLALFGAGALEASMGWYMVKTAFYPGVTSPPPIWLMPHFVFAMLIFGAMLWTALSVKNPQPQPVPGGAHLKKWLDLSILLILLTMAAGTLVAATNAITVFNTFPTMDGRWVPSNILALHPLVLNFLDNQATVQFVHRVLATLTACVVLVTAVIGLRAPLTPKARDGFLLLAGFVALQYLLGMTALVSAMVEIGYVHELNAVLLFAAAIIARHSLRGAQPASVPQLQLEASPT